MQVKEIKYMFPKQNHNKITQRNDMYGVIDENENIIVPFEYDYISDVSIKGFYEVRKNGKYGLLNMTGKEVLPCKYNKINDPTIDSFSYSSPNMLFARENEDTKYAVFDKDGNLKIPAEYDITSGAAKALFTFIF